jgi:two-component sensor histidine kinase
MNRFVASIIFLFLAISVEGQDISRHEADSLLRSLSKAYADTAHISSLLALSIFEIHKPGELKTDLDSAAAFINQAKQINVQIKSAEAYGYITLVESYIHREKGQGTQAKALVEKAIQILSNTTDKFRLGQAYMELADYYDYQDPGQLPKKIQLVELAVNSFKQSGHTEQTANGLRMLGELYSSAADSGNPGNYYNSLALALEKLKLSLALYKSIHYVKLQGIYVSLGQIYSSQTDYQQSLSYDLMALKTAESVHDTTMQLCQITNHIGITLVQLGDYEKAIDYFKNAIQTAEKYKDNETIYILASNAVDSYIRANKPLAARVFLENVSKKYARPKDNILLDSRIACFYLIIYTLLKQYHLGQPYCDQLTSIAGSNKIAKIELYNVYVALIKYYIAVNKYSSALVYLNKNNSLTHKLGEPKRIGNNHYLWFLLDSAHHHYKSAISHLLIYNSMKDSLYTVAKSRQAQQLQVQFETQKKENQIILLSQTAKLDHASLQRANLVKNITIGGIILALVIAGLFYRQYRQKQKANLAITQKNEVITQKNEVITQKNEMLQHLLTEKEWLLKEVHHRVKNNLHTVICLLESQAIYLENDALRAIENSQHRIYAMSLIHQKLYQSEDLKTIDMKVYLHEFIRYLGDSFGSTDLIHFQLDIEPLKLGVSQAIPLGLIINEAVTNSIKYAFPENRMGIISVRLRQSEAQIKLVVSDNGIGIHTRTGKNEVNSLGIDLMKGLSRDIKGKIFFDIKNGTKITVIFNADPLSNERLLASFAERNKYS